MGLPESGGLQPPSHLARTPMLSCNKVKMHRPTLYGNRTFRHSSCPGGESSRGERTGTGEGAKCLEGELSKWRNVHKSIWCSAVDCSGSDDGSPGRRGAEFRNGGGMASTGKRHWSSIIRYLSNCPAVSMHLDDGEKLTATDVLSTRRRRRIGCRCWPLGPVLLSSWKVLILEDPRGPIFKSLSLSLSSSRKFKTSKNFRGLSGLM